MAAPDAAPDLIAALAAGGSSSGSQAASALAATRALLVQHGEQALLQAGHSHATAGTVPLLCRAVKAALTATRPSSLSSSSAAAQADEARACAAVRTALCGALPAWVAAVEEPQHAQDLVAALLPEAEHLPASVLTSLLSAALTAVEQAAPHCCVLLQLLPPCLSALHAAAPPGDNEGGNGGGGGGAGEDDEEAEEDGEHGGDAGTAAASNAAKHRDVAVHRLAHARWQPEYVCQVLAVLRDLPLTQEQATQVLSKAMRTSTRANLQMLPPVLYQQLLFASVVPCLRTKLLRELVFLFEKLEKKSSAAAAGVQEAAGAPDQPAPAPPLPEQQQPSATLMQVQATFLMHVSTVVKYDVSLGSEWLKFASKDSDGLTANHVLLEVLLTLSRQPKLEAQVLQLLRRRVNEACEEAATASSSASSSGAAWMAALQPVCRSTSLAQLEEGLLKAVRCSTYASELVVPGLLQLASLLISTHCSTPLHVVLAMKQDAGSCSSMPSHAPASARAVVLGLRLLLEVFGTHAEARGEVLKLVQAKLCGGLHGALPIVLLLSRISQEQPALLTTHLPQLKECLGSFAGLDCDTAMALLLAIWPLCRSRADVSDTVVMVLRKLMYRQDVAGRLTAIRGFLCLIVQALQDNASSTARHGVLDPGAASCSQASLSQVSSLSGGRGVNLLQELLGVLRRALGQQAPVREALYGGVLQVLAADLASAELLSELLLPHVRALVPTDADALPPLLLDKCAEVSSTEAVLLEPLPALLACVHRLTSAAASGPSGHPGSLVGSQGAYGSEGGMGDDDADLSSVAALRAVFSNIRARLVACRVEHFDLGLAADLNPQELDGQLGQLRVANLIGALQVAIEDVVGEAGRLAEQQPDADQRDGAAVNALGAALAQLVRLHNQAFKLALEGSRAGSKRGKKAGGSSSSSAAAAAAKGGGTTAAAGAHKRGAPGGGLAPVHKQRPHLSAACLARLCAAVVDDGLLPLPASFDPNEPDHHARLARDAEFIAAVLRSSSNLLEHTQAAAATSALLEQHAVAAAVEGQSAGGAAAAPEVLELGPSLFKAAKFIIETMTAGGRTGVRPPAAASAAAGPARNKPPKGPPAPGWAGDGYETLEHLSASALLQLLRLADGTQQLAALFRSLPLADGTFPAGEGRGADTASADGGGAGSGDAPMPDAHGQPAAAAAGGAVRTSPADEVAAAVVPRLPMLLLCADKLLAHGCVKEAQVWLECLSLLGRRLGAAVPVSKGPGPTQATQQQPTQQQPTQPAHAVISRWAHQALQRVEPEIKSVPLVRALLELFIRFHGKDSLRPLMVTAQAIQEVRGNAADGAETQATQEHGATLPMLTFTTTAQPAAATPLAVLEEGLAQLEKLVASNLKGGVFQDGDSAAVSKARAQWATAISKRLHALLQCLVELARADITMPSIMDQQTRVATRAYKLLTTLAKAYQLPKAGPGGAQAAAGSERRLSAEFEGLVVWVHKTLTPAVTEALKAKEHGHTVQRAKKDAKLMPAMIYSMEAWEKQLVATGKAASRNLLKDAKRTFARDFRVHAAPQQQGGGARARGSGSQQDRGRARGGDGREGAGPAASHDGAARGAESGGSRRTAAEAGDDDDDARTQTDQQDDGGEGEEEEDEAVGAPGSGDEAEDDDD